MVTVFPATLLCSDRLEELDARAVPPSGVVLVASASCWKKEMA
jgi:hypothetical protein